MKVSVIVASKNRPKRLRSCLGSILKNKFVDFEVIVIMQGNGDAEAITKEIDSSKLTVFQFPKSNKSLALNYGVKNASGEVLVITDDDCIVPNNWINTIYGSYLKHDWDLMCGNVKANNGIDGMTPSTLELKKSAFVSDFKRHWKELGFGNNMSIKKEVFVGLGGFAQILGPGSIFCSGEDVDLMLRSRRLGFSVFHESKAILVHDKKMNQLEYSFEVNRYLIGGMIAYGIDGLFGNVNSIKILLWHYWKLFDTLLAVASYRSRSLSMWGGLISNLIKSILIWPFIVYMFVSESIRLRNKR